jgi:hypothetical protein
MADARQPEVPVLTDVVEDAGARGRPAIDPAALEALARDLERAMLERLGPEIDRLIGTALDGARAELAVSVQQMVREAVATSVAHALSQPKTD